MGRWSHYDTDSERLPAGMERVGYDADTQIYTYRDIDGATWEGASGARYGLLNKVSSGGKRENRGNASIDSTTVSREVYLFSCCFAYICTLSNCCQH